ncbi:hypothetical protein MnTg02_01654 [bacterium MnTg02]|nr:hypothetical protein MnTg02_01654 [bacterium MnTg02]
MNITADENRRPGLHPARRRKLHAKFSSSSINVDILRLEINGLVAAVKFIGGGNGGTNLQTR